MLKSLSIKNFKSIKNIENIALGNVNVFIGENGCGKSNILEAVGMLAAAKSFDLSTEKLYNRGIRIAKPSLTYNSFHGIKQQKEIEVKAKLDDESVISADLYAENDDDIQSDWLDVNDPFLKSMEENNLFVAEENKGFWQQNKAAEKYLMSIIEAFQSEQVSDYIIYSLNTPCLRGISNYSRKTPLGLYGEGLDILLANFSEEEWQQLLKYSTFISWLDEVVIDKDNRLKLQGHKLGRSSSILFFRDKYMQKKNNVFAAENANEGALHVLFYLALFISTKTPNFFAIDNIETALNPQICRDLMKALAALAKENNKQALITTHNPAILDGLNLHDETQKLYVVKRDDDGATLVNQIKLKPDAPKKYKLSELWMRGYIGGLPNFF